MPELRSPREDESAAIAALLSTYAPEAARTFRTEDARAVYEAQTETFEDSWEHVHQSYEEWAHWSLERPGFDPELWLLATAGYQVAGIALCRVHETDPEIGCKCAVLGVDASSLTGANRLYENVGMRVISTFDIYESQA